MLIAFTVSQPSVLKGNVNEAKPLPMNSPTIEERKQLWIFAYARASFREALSFSEAILKVGSENICAQDGLSIAATVAYSRPFKQRRSVKLCDSIVPSEYSDLHDTIIQIRDKVITHRDVDGPIADWGLVNDIILEKRGSFTRLETRSPFMSIELAQRLMSLSSHLIERMDERIEPIILKIQSLLPDDGRFVLSMMDSGPWFEQR